MAHIVSILKIEKVTKSCTLKVCSFQISFLLCKFIFILEFVPIYIKKLCKVHLLFLLYSKMGEGCLYVRFFLYCIFLSFLYRKFIMSGNSRDSAFFYHKTIFYIIFSKFNVTLCNLPLLLKN